MESIPSRISHRLTRVTSADTHPVGALIGLAHWGRVNWTHESSVHGRYWASAYSCWLDLLSRKAAAREIASRRGHARVIRERGALAFHSHSMGTLNRSPWL